MICFVCNVEVGAFMRNVFGKLLARDLCHGRQRVSLFYHVLFYLQRWSSCCHQMNVFGRLLARDLVRSRQRVPPIYHDPGLDLVGLIVNFFPCCTTCPSGRWATSEPNSFIQSCSKKILGGGRSDAYTFVKNFSSFHPNNFRNTISWKCFVKNDSVRSCLIELQSFLQSKVDVDPTHRVLMFLPSFMHVLCMTRCIQVDRIRILMVFCPRDPQAERILSVGLLLKFWPPGINPELMMEMKLIAHPTW